MSRTHYNDQHGPICGAHGGKLYTPTEKPAPSSEIGVVDCRRCVKKLVQWGHAIQHFNLAVRDAVRESQRKER